MTERNFTERLDVEYPAGHFDMSLNLIDGNPLIYRFFDSKVYFSIYKLLSPEEQSKISDLAKRCLEAPHLRFDECVHIRHGNSIDCYVITMQKTPDADSYDVELVNVSQSKHLINELNDRLDIARSFITLFGEAIFTYTPQNNNFHLFIVNNSQNVDLFDMDFDEWTSLILKKELVASEDAEAFETFCYILKNAAVSQTFTFHGCILTDQNVQEKYRVSFAPKPSPYGGNIVTGTWAIINEFSNDVESNAFEAAYIDGLTGLLNKKAIMRYAEKAVDNVEKTGRQVAIAVMDVDNFKSVNDNYGHLFGDKVIKAVGDVIKRAIGSDAVAGRMGGDEFLIVFEKFSDELEYRNVLRCIKTNVSYVYPNKFGEDNKLTCSIGLGRYGIGSCSTTFHDLFKIADRALYLAKQKGKNRYIIYKPELHGDFNSPDDTSDIVNIINTYYAEEDIDRLHALLSDTVIYGSEVIDDLIDQLTHILMLDRLNVFIGDSKTPDYLNTAAARDKLAFSDSSVIRDEQYLSIFTKNEIVVSNIHGIEYTLPDVYRRFANAGISSLMQFLLTDKNGKVAGLITAEVFNNFTAFPKIAIQLFEITCRTINSVLIREEKI